MKGIINFIVNDNRQKIAIANIQIHILTSILSSLGGPKQPKKVEWFELGYEGWAKETL